MSNTNGQHPLLRILVIIVSADKMKAITELLNEFNCHVQSQFHASGTATSEILNIFGLGATEKLVATCVLPNSFVASVLRGLLEEFSFRLPGKGVAFTIPVSGISGQASALVNTDINIENTESEVSNMGIEIGHHLIVAAVNYGYSEELIDAARSVGATGGTVWIARNASSEHMVKLMGAPVQDEQEIVIILTEKSKKLEIMKALNDEFGVSSKAQGIILSLPVDQVLGLGKASGKTEK